MLSLNIALTLSVTDTMDLISALDCAAMHKAHLAKWGDLSLEGQALFLQDAGRIKKLQYEVERQYNQQQDEFHKEIERICGKAQ